MLEYMPERMPDHCMERSADAHLPVAHPLAHDLQALAAIAGEAHAHDPVTEASGRRLDQRDDALFHWVRRAQRRLPSIKKAAGFRPAAASPPETSAMCWIGI